MPNRFDNFNRDPGAIGTPSDMGSAWIVQSGNWVIGSLSAADQAVMNNGASLASCVLESGAANVEVQVTVGTGSPTDIGIVFRVTDNNNYFLMGFRTDGEVRLYRRSGGSFSLDASASMPTTTNGDVLKVVANGSSIKAYKNGTEYLSTTNTNHATATKHGMFANGSSSSWEDFSITELAGDTTPPTLNTATATVTGATTATLGVTTTGDANGTMYAVVTTSGSPPTAAQIRAGQNHLSAAATWASNPSNNVTVTTNPQTVNFSATGLTAGVTYWAHFHHQDAAGNNSSVLSSSSFVPTSGFIPSRNLMLLGIG